MTGYHGLFLKVNLTTGEITDESYPEEWKKKYIGGRGFAVKYLWDNLPEGADPLGPDNILMFMIGPLSGLSLPSSSKMIVAAKSPLTGGYGDGNLGTKASPQLKKAGYDGIIVTGKAEKPKYLEITDNGSKLHDASDLWGLGTYDTEKKLLETYKKSAGILTIGQAGENLISYATVRSQEGRSGGRPGIGAVMGSKMLKAIVVSGKKEFPIADKEAAKEMGSAGYKFVKGADFYDGWMHAGTTMILEWCEETSSLPTRNFQEGQFEGYKGVDANELAKTETARYGCPNCNMHCGVAIKDHDGNESELDYENIGMLGPNVGIDSLPKVGVLNWMADDFGFDTISLGSVLGMATEAAEKGKLDEKLKFGDYESLKAMVNRIVKREDDLADLLAKGTRKMAETWGGDAKNWAIQVKGLECSAYNAFTIPGMALSFGTSPIGAHHKDAWVISFEITEMERDSYARPKAEKVIELQRIRGGMFESLVTCRFPWIELGYDLENYPKYLHKVTGSDHWNIDEVFKVSDRIYSLIRAFWVREYKKAGIDWDRFQDYPPQRWFNETLKGDGPHAGQNLDKEKYDGLLSDYYDIRGWDERGIPKPETCEKLSISEEYNKLKPFL
ncbi:MAG: aldehyde ferredoxin oxidoreductase family protein [Candidatus Heimdallarchaeota archaeon]|nr:aldehyde ferredoxin oxidoreductase family protein [Candidatus Heimdallarchaeota archaeon]